MKKNLSPRRSFAFTLVELLVVISIIAVLASLTFTSVQSALLASKKVSAKNDMMQLATAVTCYYTEYGFYPNPDSKTADDYYGNGDGAGPNNSKIVNILRSVSTSGTTTDNTRQIKFIQPKVVAATKGCVNSADGNWNDPWGKQYLIFLDYGYDDAITVSKVIGGLTDPSVGVGTASVGLFFNNKGKTLSYDSVLGKKSILLSWQ